MRLVRQWSAERDTVIFRAVPDDHYCLRTVLSDNDIFTPEEFARELAKRGAFVIQPITDSPPSV